MRKWINGDELFGKSIGLCIRLLKKLVVKQKGEILTSSLLNLYFWDSASIAELDNSEIKRGINILESIISFWENKKDYGNYRWNEDISKVLKGNSIQDYIDYREYVINNLVSMQNVEQQLEKWDSTIQIYNCTLLFRQETPEELKEEH